MRLKKLVRIILWGLLTLCVGYGLLALYYFSGTPRPTIDYVAQINRLALSAPIDQSAWPIYRDVMTRSKFIPNSRLGWDDIFVDDSNAVSSPRLVEPRDGEQWERALSKLEGSKDLLDCLRDGGSKQFLGLILHADPNDYPIPEQQALFPTEIPRFGSFTEEMLKQSPLVQELASGSIINCHMPHLVALGQSARILVVDTRRALEQNDWERAVQNLEALFGLARQSAENRTMLATLVGCAISGWACDAVDETLATATNHLTSEHLARIQTAVNCDNVWDWVDLKAEKMMCEDMLQRLFTDNGSGDGRITAVGFELLSGFSVAPFFGSKPGSSQGLGQRIREGFYQFASPLMLFILPSRRDHFEYLAERYQIFENRFFGPYHLDDLTDLEVGGDRRFFLVDLFLPALRLYRESIVKVDINRQTTAADVAIHRYYRQHGGWPEQVDDLPTELLDGFPRDPLNGQPLRYSKQPGGFIIYGFGHDGDDDSGKRIMIRNRAIRAWDRTDNDKLYPQSAGDFSFHKPLILDDGDWIAWPRKN